MSDELITTSQRERERERESLIAPNHKDISRRRFLTIAGVSALALSSLGGSLAYFTGTDVKENKLSVANNLNVEVIEPNWDPENAKHLVPTQTVPKDPQIKNLSDQYTGYLYLEIQVPIVNAKIYDEKSKEVIGPERVELFTYTPSDKFILLEEFENEDYIIRRYAYPDIIEPLGITPTIFDEVTVANLASGEGISGKHNINVIGYGIQSEGFSSYEDAWVAYKNQNGLKSGGEVGNKVSAVLIAGATGNKLQFMNSTPSVGDMLDTGEVIEVVEDVEHLPAGDRSPLVSAENIGTVTTVEDVVTTKPENTVNWFKDMDSVTEINISGLDVSEVTDKTGMLDGLNSLKQIIVSESITLDDIPYEDMHIKDDNQFIYYAPAYLAYYQDYNDTTCVIGRCVEIPNEYEGKRLMRGWRGIETTRYALQKVGDETYPEWPRCKAPWNEYGTSNVNHVVCIDNVAPLSVSGWFSNAQHLVDVDLNLMDFSSCANFNYLFSGCGLLETVEGINVGKNAVLLRGVFEDCRNLRHIDCSDWETSKVSDMFCLFSGCENLKELNLNSFNTTNVINISSMFARCSSLNQIDVSNFSFSQEVSVSAMFSYCENLTKLDLSGWGTVSVNYAGGMFSDCVNLTELLLPNFNMSNCTHLDSMFRNCGKLKNINSVANWDCQLVENFNYVFYYCKELVVDCSSWVTPIWNDTYYRHDDFSTKAPGVIPPTWH